MKLLLAAWVLCLLACASSACVSTNRDVAKADLHLRIGNRFLEEGNYPAALRELTEAERLNPDSPMILNNLAIAYYVRNRFDDAEKYLLKALDADSKYSEARNNLGRVYLDRGQADKAIEHLKIVAADLTYANPEKALTNLGEAQLKKKNYLEARKNLADALRIKRDYCPAHALYGKTLFLTKDFPRAARALDTALDLCRGLDEAHYYNALSYFELGDSTRGRTRLLELQNLYPTSPFALKAREYNEMKR